MKNTPQNISNNRLIVESFINDFLSSSENDNGIHEDLFDQNPLFGYSNGNDSLFSDLKKYVGEFHLSPNEIIRNIFPDKNIDSDNLTVISFALPHSEKSRLANRQCKKYPSHKWLRGRILG